MANVEKLDFYRGRTCSRGLLIQGWGKRIDQVYFTVKADAEDKTYVLQKTLGNGITLTDEELDELGNPIFSEFNLFIDATDTDNLDVNKNYDFDITIISENIKETAIIGKLRLKETSTMTFNEKEGI